MQSAKPVAKESSSHPLSHKTLDGDRLSLRALRPLLENSLAVMSLIETREVSRVYQMGSNQVTAHDHVSMAAAEGEFVAIQGTPGPGKPTPLNLAGA